MEVNVIEKNVRDSRIELLRIFCILGITLHHLVYHSSIMNESLTINRAISQFFILFGKYGVNIFVLITGYFSAIKISSIDFRKTLRKVSKTHRKLLQYSLITLIVIALVNPSLIEITKLFKSVLPVVSGSYWFMTAFIGLQLVSPFLDRFISCLSEKELNILILLGFVMFAVLPINTWCSDFLWFVYLYFVGIFIHRQKYFHLSKAVWGVLSLGSLLIMWFASLVISLIANDFYGFNKYINYFGFRQNSIFMLTASVGMFCFMINTKPFDSKLINKIAKHTLSCYLIQSNVFLSSILWQFVDSAISKTTPWYPVLVIGCVFILCIIFIMIDVALSGPWLLITSIYRKFKNNRK